MIFIAEKTYRGLMGAVYYSFIKDIIPEDIITKEEYKLYKDNEKQYEIINVSKDNCIRVDVALRGYSGFQIKQSVKACLMSCERKAFKIAFDFVHTTLKKRKNIAMEMTEYSANEFFYTTQKVINEAVFQKRAIVFEQCKNGILFGKFAPKNNIIGALSVYFLTLFRDKPYVLYDTSRNQIAVSNGNDAWTGKTSYSPEFIKNDKIENIKLIQEKYINTK